MKRLGVDVGGTFTDLIYVDDEAGTILIHKIASTPDDPSRGTVQGIKELTDAGRGHAGRPRPGLPRHDDRHQHRDRAQRRDRRDDHHRGLPRHPAHRAAQEAAELLQLSGPPLAALSARPPALSPDRARADRRGRRGARPARRGTRARAGPPAQGDGRRRGRRVLSVLVPERRARAARGRDRPRGVPGGIPLGLLRRASAVPRVRALLDRGAECLRRPDGGGVRAAPRGRAARARRAHRRFT